MAIYRLLQESAFDPDHIERMTGAFEKCLVLLGLKDRSDPLTELVAKTVIEEAQTGLKDPDLIAIKTLARLGIMPKS